MLRQMSGKTEHVLILGGSSGIGLATADLLLQLGYKVTIAGRDGNRLDRALASLKGDIESLRVDAANLDQIRGVFSQLRSLSHLVLALGSDKGMGPFSSVTLPSLLPDGPVFPMVQGKGVPLGILTLRNKANWAFGRRS
jgi:NAD(P)-dependent dehydrogenase (short-subunit alcohol dehydrogenase family)